MYMLLPHLCKGQCPQTNDNFPSGSLQVTSTKKATAIDFQWL